MLCLELTFFKMTCVCVSLSVCSLSLADMRELESQLVEAQDARIKLIVSDGVFSMDGSITPLRYVCNTLVA